MKKSVLYITLISLTILFACKSEEKPEIMKQAPQPLSANESATPQGFSMDTPPLELDKGKKGELIIEVPDDIQNLWDAVEVEVMDKKNNTTETYSVKRDEEISVKGTELKVTVTHFIPHFTMGKGVMTSLDADPENPAIYMIVKEGDTELWRGISFMNYPDTHAFDHEKYRVVMIGYIIKR